MLSKTLKDVPQCLVGFLKEESEILDIEFRQTWLHILSQYLFEVEPFLVDKCEIVVDLSSDNESKLNYLNYLYKENKKKITKLEKCHKKVYRKVSKRKNKDVK